MRSIPIALIIIASLWFSHVHATPIVNSSGQLTGAKDVSVNGVLYDVEFMDGTCIALFNGCDDTADFTFQTEDSAKAASRALLNQVFVDGISGNFDTDPELTTGCSDNTRCLAETPYEIQVSTTVNVLTQAAVNTDAGDFITPDIRRPLEDFMGDSKVSRFVWAKWTPSGTTNPVSLPSTLILLVSGILGIMTLRRNQTM